jgi:hypothetical protein
MGSGEPKVVMLIGPALTGKTTVLRRLGELKAAKLGRMTPAPPGFANDGGVSAEWQEGGQAYRVITLGGAVWDFNSWRGIAPKEHKVIFVTDVQNISSDRTVEELVKASYFGLSPIVAVQITKVDLVADIPRDLHSLQMTLKFAGIPCFLSREDQPATQIAACCHVLGCSVVG